MGPYPVLPELLEYNKIIPEVITLQYGYLSRFTQQTISGTASYLYSDPPVLTWVLIPCS